MKRDTKFGDESTCRFKIGIRNLTKNLTWALESLKQIYFNGLLLSKVYMYCYILEFDKIWLEHWKVSKKFILMRSYWANYVLFELKNNTGIIFHETEEGYKIWRGIDLSFQDWHKKFDKFWAEHSKVSKIFPLMGSFWEKYILFELEKVQRSCLLLHSRMMRNLKKNWLVVWKMR